LSLLNLPHLSVTGDLEPHGEDYLLPVKASEPPKACLKCGVIGGYRRFGTRKQVYRDTPLHSRRLGLLVTVQRYRCLDCNAVFQDSLPDMDEKRKATRRLVRWIEDASLVRTFTSISDEVGLDEKSIRNIFWDYVTELEKTVTFDTPEWMGIDELTMVRKPRCIITNVEAKTIVGMLSDRNKPSVVRYLTLLSDRASIKGVCMDMWTPYRDAVKSVLPDAVIVVDVFHVVRMANQCLDAVRKSIRAELTDKERRTLMHDRFLLLKRKSQLNEQQELTLETWTLNFPVLRAAYDTKEAFYAIYDAATRSEAEAQYRVWESGLSEFIRPRFKILTTAVKNWHTEIFNYFDYKFTNGYTECLNGLVKVANRQGRGYSFEAIRAKILFANSLHKKRRPKYGEVPMTEQTNVVKETNEPLPATFRSEGVLLRMIDPSLYQWPAQVDDSEVSTWIDEISGQLKLPISTESSE
jgi:transposase